jgi:hypothetical protein
MKSLIKDAMIKKNQVRKWPAEAWASHRLCSLALLLPPACQRFALERVFINLVPGKLGGGVGHIPAWWRGGWGREGPPLSCLYWRRSSTAVPLQPPSPPAGPNASTRRHSAQGLCIVDGVGVFVARRASAYLSRPPPSWAR